MNRFFLILSLLLISIASGAAAEPDQEGYRTIVKPFLLKHCNQCHGSETQEANLAFHQLDSKLVGGKQTETWIRIYDQLNLGEMPPRDAPQPSQNKRERIAKWIRSELHRGGHFVEDKLHRRGFGNYIRHELLFGDSEVQPSSSPPRLWRIRPAVYDAATQQLAKGTYTRPFTLKAGDGFRDFDNLYKLAGPDLNLLLTNTNSVATRLVEVIRKDGQLQRGSQTPQQIFNLIHPENKQPSSEQLDAAINWIYGRVLLRPPTQEEHDRLIAFTRKSIQENGRILGVRNMVSAVLLNPEGLYRSEIGAGKPDKHGRMMLAPRELAYAIAYALTDRHPDSILLKAASEDKLATRTEIATQVGRILNDDKINKPRILSFFREYFEYVGAADIFKDKELFRSHAPRVLVRDTDQLIMYLYEQDKDVLRELLTTRKSFVQYGLDRDGNPNNMGEADRRNYLSYSLPLDWKWIIEQPVELPTNQRAGILTQPAWLVAKSDNFDNHAIRRGLWIRTKLLGGTVPDLPITVDAQLPNDETLTLRERMKVTREQYCWKCHERMNPLGLAFEQYDHFGRWRTKEQGKPVDSSGAIGLTGIDTLDANVSDPIELVHKLANSERVRQVFIRHAFRYWMGRNETVLDAATLRRADKDYVASGGSMKALITSLLTSDSFLYRRVESVTVKNE
jgi:mono/diheme cytochrome c family protein